MAVLIHVKNALNNPLVQINSQIGFTIGIMLGAFFGWIFLFLFMDWEWYFKLFSSVGSLSIIGSLGMGLYQLIQQRKNYLEVEMESEKIRLQCNETLQAPIGLLSTEIKKPKRKRRTKQEIQSQLKNDNANTNVVENLDSSNI